VKKYPGVTQINGGYVIRVTHQVNGKQKEAIRTLKGVSLSEAVVKREELRKEIAGTPPEELTVSQLAERWLSHLGSTGRCRPQILQNRRIVLSRFINPFFGEMKLHSVKRSDIGLWIEWLAEKRTPKGELYSQDYISFVWNTLKGMLNDAVNLANLQSPPHKGWRLKIPTKSPRKKDSLTKDELARFLQAAELERPDTKLALWIMGTTGLRHSEATALTWEDVDFDAGWIKVNKSQVQQRVGETKTPDSKRTVPLHPRLKSLLLLEQERQKLLSVPNPRNLIVTARLGRHKIHSSLAGPMARCAKRAGISKHVSTHVFRHTVNNLIRKEAGSVTAMAFLGHKTEKMHLRYSTVDLDELNQAQSLGLGLGGEDKEDV
jgi:integrase